MILAVIFYLLLLNLYFQNGNLKREVTNHHFRYPCDYPHLFVMLVN
jgi:hypothetical protein